MGKRSTGRRLAMQILFQLDMGQDDTQFALHSSAESEQFLPETVEFAQSIVDGVKANLQDLDAFIQEKSIGWSLERITGVDKAILRSAIYEIRYLNTPASVVINEAVNLAKRFSTEDSSKFVNGILGTLV